MKQLSPTLLFGLRFMVYFAILMGMFEASRGSMVERVVVEEGILAPAVDLIRTVDRKDDVELRGRTIQSPTSRLRVTRGCEGIEVFLILIAGVVAFPADWKSKLSGLAIGAMIAYGLSLLRLMALHLTLRYSPGAWEALHGLVLPLGPIVVISLYFLRWSGRVTAPAAQHAT
jgi:exosortase/archaeosortase family protein